MHPTLMLMYLDANRAERERRLRAERPSSGRIRTRLTRESR
jgi:hypothetical protein